MLPFFNQKTPRRRMSDQFKFKLYEWAEWATKLMIVGMFGFVWQNNNDMQRIKTQLETQATAQSNINASVKAELIAIREGYMTRMEVLETVKRVEQNQEIMMLRFKLDKKGGT
jgi:replication initiation and membrane attachment protein DnaB